AGARRDPESAARRRDRDGVVLRHTAAPAAGAPVPRLRGRLAAGDGESGCGELLGPAVADHLGRAAGTRRRRRPLCGRRRRIGMTGFGRHRVFQLLVDAGIVALSWFLAFQLRFDNGPPYIYDNLFRKTILLVVAIKVVVFLLFGFHRRWWRYVSVHDMWSAARVVGARLLARTVMERPRSGDLVARGREVIVVGAGDAGRTVVQEMQRSRMLRYTPIGFVDDDRAKLKSRIQGVPVLGTMAALPRLVRERQPDEILIAIPSASGRLRQRVVDAAQSLNVPVKTLPGLYELISGQVDLAQIRPVQVEDVLGREQVEVPLDDVAAYLRDQTVLVTGAGGSIGAELCRQIARVGPARIVLVDQAETALF